MRKRELRAKNWEEKILTDIVKRQAKTQLDRTKLYHEKTPRKSQFITVPYALVDNEDYRNGFLRKKRFRTYYWLRRYVIRASHPNDPLDLFRTYWMKGELASCVSLKKIAKDLEIPLSTARSHIKQLEKDGIIKVDRYDADDTPDGKKHEVYILGTCVDGNERWFIDEIFLNKKKSN